MKLTYDIFNDILETRKHFVKKQEYPIDLPDDLYERIDKILCEFKPRYQTIIKLRYKDKKTFTAISEEVGLGRNTVHENIGRVLKQIGRKHFLYITNQKLSFDTSIYDLNLRLNVLAALHSGGCETIRDLLDCDVSRCTRGGDVTAKRVEELIQQVKTMQINEA